MLVKVGVNHTLTEHAGFSRYHLTQRGVKRKTNRIALGALGMLGGLTDSYT